MLLFLAGALALIPLMIALLFLSSHRGWLAVPILAIAFFVFWAMLKIINRRKENRRKKRFFEDYDISEVQKEFEEALRYSTDTLRLGKSILFARGRGRLIPFASIYRIQRAYVRDVPVHRMDVWDEEKQSIDLRLSSLSFSLPDGLTMSAEEFEALLRKHCPSLQLGMPVIDQ